MSGCGCYCVDVAAETSEPLDSLMRHVAPQMPTVPYEMAMDAIRMSYIEFARRTKLLAYTQRLPIQRGVRTYLLDPPEGYEIYGVLGVEHEPYIYYPTPHRWFFQRGWRMRMLGNSEVEFECEPATDAYDRHLRFHLLPNQCADTIPLEISTPFGYGIATGAVSKLLDSPSKQWGNPELAAKKHRDFARVAAEGLNKHITNNGAAPAHFRPVRIL